MGMRFPRSPATRRALFAALAVLPFVGAAVQSYAAVNPPKVRTARVSTNGCVGGNGASIETVALSQDTRLVGFASQATNLVPGDTNASDDVFVHDRIANTTERVSVGSGGVQANDDSVFPSFSADGRYVAFHSIATNLVSGDTNGSADVFLRDRLTGVTELVSLGPGGERGNGHSVDPQLSADGRYVAFFSNAWTAPYFNVFVRDRLLRTTEMVSRKGVPTDGLVSSEGWPGPDGDSFSPAISGDGRFVAFHSGSTILNPQYRQLVAGQPASPGDLNGAADVFVHDRLLDWTTRVSVGLLGIEANGASAHPAISADGRYIAYHSVASNLVPLDTNGTADIFVYDRITGVTTRANTNAVADVVVQPNAGSFFPALTASGDVVAFFSAASNLDVRDGNGVYDVFIHHRPTTLTSLLSAPFAGLSGNGPSIHPALGAEPAVVAFNSSATNFVPDDTNGVDDTFVGDPSGTYEGLSPVSTPRSVPSSTVPALCPIPDPPSTVTGPTSPPTSTPGTPPSTLPPTTVPPAATTLPFEIPTTTTSVPLPPVGDPVPECAFIDPFDTTVSEILACVGLGPTP